MFGPSGPQKAFRAQKGPSGQEGPKKKTSKGKQDLPGMRKNSPNGGERRCGKRREVVFLAVPHAEVAREQAARDTAARELAAKEMAAAREEEAAQAAREAARLEAVAREEEAAASRRNLSHSRQILFSFGPSGPAQKGPSGPEGPRKNASEGKQDLPGM